MQTHNSRGQSIICCTLVYAMMPYYVAVNNISSIAVAGGVLPIAQLFSPIYQYSLATKHKSCLKGLLFITNRLEMLVC